jgi:hypothetical protein
MFCYGPSESLVHNYQLQNIEPPFVLLLKEVEPHFLGNFSFTLAV